MAPEPAKVKEILNLVGYLRYYSRQGGLKLVCSWRAKTKREP